LASKKKPRRGKKRLHPPARKAAGSIEPNRKEQLVQVSEQIIHSGPLPSPEQLVKYDEVVPGAARRIMEAADEQRKHRIAIEKQVVSSQMKESNRGQIMGFIIALIGLSLGSFLVYSGHDVAGASIAGITLVGLVTVFIKGQNRQDKDLKEKDPR